MPSTFSVVRLSSRDLKVAVKLFLTIYVVALLFFKPSVEFARFFHLTEAITQSGQTSIDRIEKQYHVTVIDAFEHNGKRYIIASPGLSYIALATYFPYSLFVKHKLNARLNLEPETDLKLSQLVMSLSTISFFTGLLISIFFLSLRLKGLSMNTSIFYSFFLYFGTPILYYSLEVPNSQVLLTASLLFAAFYVLQLVSQNGKKQALLSGLIAGITCFVDTSSIFYLFLFPALLFLTGRGRAILIWAAGFLVGICPLFLYNQISFGHPLITAFTQSGASIKFDVVSALKMILFLIFSPKCGLIFFSPFIAFVLSRDVWSSVQNKVIAISTIFFLGCLGFLIYSAVISYKVGDQWYLNQGGGGPRYLLPIIPFLVYLLADVTWRKDWRTNFAVFFIALSFLINIPGLFWRGGQAFFLNNLVLFLKNGFHSYLIDLFKDILDHALLNTKGISLLPITALVGFLLWFIWKGKQKMHDLLDPS